MAGVFDTVFTLVTTVVFGPTVGQGDQELSPCMSLVQHLTEMTDGNAHAGVGFGANAADALTHIQVIGLAEFLDMKYFAALISATREAIDGIADQGNISITWFDKGQ